jgi:hypothetical protein
MSKEKRIERDSVCKNFESKYPSLPEGILSEGGSKEEGSVRELSSLILTFKVFGDSIRKGLIP